jgi:hypothetical protein
VLPSKCPPCSDPASCHLAFLAEPSQRCWLRPFSQLWGQKSKSECRWSASGEASSCTADDCLRPDHLPKASPPDTVTLVWTATCEFGVGDTNKYAKLISFSV